MNQIDTIEPHQIIFKYPIKNQNSKYINYYKLLYSDPNVHLKYILLSLNTSIAVDKKEIFFEKLKKLEYLLLSSINQHINKNIKIHLYHDLISKENSYISQNIYIKISGIWEDNLYIGLVYKLYYATSTVKFSNMIC